MKTEVISFRQTVPAGNESSFKERLKADGHVEHVSIRFYPGVEESLQVIPFVLHKGRRREDLFTYAENTRAYITGDNDFLQFPVTCDFEYDDEFYVNAKNTDLVNDYTLCVDVLINYEEAGDSYNEE